ncbi:MAG: RDD family protein [Chitinophagaceae bacterium]|nr:RDD family protein [Chitinophagaceae bacterium]
MPVIRIRTNFNIDIEFPGSSFHRRLFAWLIDLFIQIFYIIIASKFLHWLSNQFPETRDMNYNFWAIGSVLILPFFTYHLVSEITMNGQSIGKKLMRLKVISENGGRPSIDQYIIRWLIRTSDYTLLIIIIMIPYMQYYGATIYWGVVGALALLVTDIILVNSRKHQRLGDILAHTVVIKNAQQGTIADTIFLEVADDYIPSFPQVMELNDRDVNALKEILATARETHNYELAGQASEKVKDHLKVNSLQSPFEFLEVLLKDYNYLSGR